MKYKVVKNFELNGVHYKEHQEFDTTPLTPEEIAKLIEEGKVKLA